jgi:two-component system, OmpR family, heavy metal sensor histidine kinase CusS
VHWRDATLSLVDRRETGSRADYVAHGLVRVFGVGGGVLYHALAQQVRAQDDFDPVLTARHLRRLTIELDSVQGIRLNESRLDSLVLGSEAFLCACRTQAGR